MPRQIRTVLVGVASLEEEDPVLRPAIELAREFGATLHVMHAFDLPEPIQDAYAQQIFLHSRTHLDRYAEELRARVEAQVGGVSSDPSIVCHVVAGAASERLCELARTIGADLLLVGATRRSRIWRQVLGVTAEGVIRRAEVPVLVLRQSLRRQVRRILLTCDLSELSTCVHEEGMEMVATLFGSPASDYRSLLVVEYEDASALPLSREVIERVAQEQLQRFLQQPGLRQWKMDAGVRIGNPADEILSEAIEWSAELLVLGTHARAGMHRFLLGSVAGAVLRGASCNVLVIPAQAVAERRANGATPASRDVEQDVAVL